MYEFGNQTKGGAGRGEGVEGREGGKVGKT